MDQEQTHRKFKPKSAGPSADKKQAKKIAKSGGRDLKGKNPKAFAISKPVSFEQDFRRTADIKTKKLHMPKVDRRSTQPPPLVVAIVGPPKVGKTTLIKGLIKCFTKHVVNEIRGPLTVVTGPKTRLTLYECVNDLSAMMDVAKVADLVVLMIDASFGFEMETFEFLNILQTHGFPKIIGVLNHLDKYKTGKVINKVKKVYKRRFWEDIYKGAKLFHLNGLIDNQYPYIEMQNLARYINLKETFPLQWRIQHPYMVVDRMEDITEMESVKADQNCDRTVSLYGYVRGTRLKPNSKVHIPGSGDYEIASITPLGDPCPPPKRSKEEKGKRVDKKNKMIYAPMSDINTVIYDKDAIYVDVQKGALSFDDEEEGEEQGPGQEMVRQLHKTQFSIDEKMKEGSDTFSVFGNSQGQPYEETKTERNGNSAGEEKKVGKGIKEVKVEDNGRVRRKVMFTNEIDVNSDEEDEEDDVDDSFNFGKSMLQDEDEGAEDLQFEGDSDEEDEGDEEYQNANAGGDEEEEGESDEEMEEAIEEEDVEEAANRRWKEKMSTISTYEAQRVEQLADIIYGKLRDRTGTTRYDDDVNQVDSAKFIPKESEVRDFMADDKLAQLLKKRFVGKGDIISTVKGVGDADGTFMGDFEDLEEGKAYSGTSVTPLGAKGKKRKGGDEDEEDEGGDDFGGDYGEKQEGKGTDKKTSAQSAKEKLKQNFDAEYDNDKTKAQTGKRGRGGREEGRNPLLDGLLNDGPTLADLMKQKLDQQKAKNDAEFEDVDPIQRIQLQGVEPGEYVRIVLESVPAEFVIHFNPLFPYIVGGLLPGEDTLGLIQLKFKKHRWHKKILKTGDPIIVSVGWRRYQTIPLYSTRDINLRNRMLKYTPEHTHCIATIFGPSTAPQTGVIAFQTVSNQVAEFRVAGTGSITELDKAYTIVKKLKLTGVPYKIGKKTAFISGMFTSSLEVAKFVGSKIRTVSGIRGQIKKAERTEGRFRATFEDMISMKDIVFLRAWYPVTPVKFYNPMTSHHLEARNQWQAKLAMKITRQIRAERGLAIPVKQDSLYKVIERAPFIAPTLNIPANLRANLPIELQILRPKGSKQKKESLMDGLDEKEEGLAVVGERRGVILEPKEQRVRQLLKDLKEIQQMKKSAFLQKKKEKYEDYEKRMEEEKIYSAGKRKQRTKMEHIKHGLISKAKEHGFKSLQLKKKRKAED